MQFFFFVKKKLFAKKKKPLEIKLCPSDYHMRSEDICVSVKPAARMILGLPDVLENPGVPQHIRCLPMIFSSVVNQHKKIRHKCKAYTPS